MDSIDNVSALESEYNLFYNLYNEFANINVWLLPTDLFQEYVNAKAFDCIVTISNGKIVVCVNNSGELQIEEFRIEDYKYAADWCLGKIKYQDYLDLPYCSLKKVDKDTDEITDEDLQFDSNLIVDFITLIKTDQNRN